MSNDTDKYVDLNDRLRNEVRVLFGEEGLKHADIEARHNKLKQQAKEANVTNLTITKIQAAFC